MWSQLYRDHLIMPFPSYDTATNAWVPQADITWCVGSARDFEFVRFPKRVGSEIEAVRCALELGREWVDDRLRRAATGQRQVIDMIGALKGRAARAQARGGSGIAPVREARDRFTFDQFKSLIALQGLDVPQDRLEQSYVALLNLRKQNRWSWAQTRRRVERSQQESAGRRPAKRRLPLTEREWRRIS